jgi:hypothetical protein
MDMKKLYNALSSQKHNEENLKKKTDVGRTLSEPLKKPAKEIPSKNSRIIEDPSHVNSSTPILYINSEIICS